MSAPRVRRDPGKTEAKIQGRRQAARFKSSIPDQGGALRAPRGTVPDAAASARAGRAASGRSPHGARLRDCPATPTIRMPHATADRQCPDPEHAPPPEPGEQDDGDERGRLATAGTSSAGTPASRASSRRPSPRTSVGFRCVATTGSWMPYLHCATSLWSTGSGSSEQGSSTHHAAC